MSKMCPYIGIKHGVSKLTLLLVGSPSVFYVLVFVFLDRTSVAAEDEGVYMEEEKQPLIQPEVTGILNVHIF